MRSLLCMVTFVSLMAFAGCGNTKPTSPTAQSEEQVISDQLARIASNTFASDEETLSAYLALYPYKPTVFPKEGSPWASFRKTEHGYMLVIDRLDPVCLNRSTSQAQDPLQLERDGIKAAAELCHKFLSDLGPRKLTAISYTLVDVAGTNANGAELYVDRFRVIVTPSDLEKLRALSEEPALGSVFDPRGSKVNTFWTVQKNRYPRVSYDALASAQALSLEQIEAK